MNIHLSDIVEPSHLIIFSFLWKEKKKENTAPVKLLNAIHNCSVCWRPSDKLMW